jgi:hypothetical protein
MNTPTIIAIVVAIIIAAVAVMAIRTVSTSRALKDRYGDEYDRAITEHGGRSAAEAELKRRVRAHDDLTLTELSADRVEHFREAWTGLQAQFIDDPTAVVRAADGLVTELVTERGYPDVDFDERVTHLSVDHARVLGAYRDAHTIAERSNAGWASTEDLRRAVVSYRDVIADVLGETSLGGTGLDGATFESTAFDSTAFDGTAVDAATADPAVVPAEDQIDRDLAGSAYRDSVPADRVPGDDVRNDADLADRSDADGEVVPADAPAIPTVDGAEPTSADISANEGYVTASTRSTRE